jgi:hypothetical protein
MFLLKWINKRTAGRLQTSAKANFGRSELQMKPANEACLRGLEFFDTIAMKYEALVKTS